MLMTSFNETLLANLDKLQVTKTNRQITSALVHMGSYSGIIYPLITEGQSTNQGLLQPIAQAMWW